MFDFTRPMMGCNDSSNNISFPDIFFAKSSKIALLHPNSHALIDLQYVDRVLNLIFLPIMSFISSIFHFVCNIASLPSLGHFLSTTFWLFLFSWLAVSFCRAAGLHMNGASLLQMQWAAVTKNCLLIRVPVHLKQQVDGVTASYLSWYLLVWTSFAKLLKEQLFELLFSTITLNEPLLFEIQKNPGPKK